MFNETAREFNLPVVVVPEKCNSVKAVLEHLVAGLIGSEQVAPDSHRSIVEKLLQKESLNTSQYLDVALPHAMSATVLSPMGIVGEVLHGVQWEPHSPRPVAWACLLLCDANCQDLDLYMRMLHYAALDIDKRAVRLNAWRISY